jgi:subtilase family serine protease
LLTLVPNVAFGQPATKTVAEELSQPPAAVANAKVRAAHASIAALELNVGLSVRNDGQLKAAIAAASTPGSPSYGKYLTKADYMASYAPTDAQVAAVESWLSEEGLQVTGSSSDNLIVHVKGSTAAAEHAFGVAISDYTGADGRTFYAPDSSPSVPADLAIESVSGLSDAVKAVTASKCIGTECGATGLELLTTYNSPANAEGETIAYALWGKPLTKETFSAYAEKTGTTELKLGSGNEEIEFKEVGGANKETGEAEKGSITEEALDTESAHVVAPKAHHIYFLANENTFAKLETTVHEASESTAKVISNSWEVEGLACSVSAPGMEAILEKAVSLGKTVFFSTGDDGAAHGCAYPSSSQYVVAVGGTRAEIGPKGEYKTETALKDGGNCNNGIARPSWQTGLGAVFVYPASSCTGRVTPDISAISAYSGEETFPQGEPFLLVFFYSGSTFFGKSGGTSLSAPVWTAGSADWNHANALEGRPGIGFVDPTLYALANDANEYGFDFHDVKEGTNGFAARAGYDEATGWGSPNFFELDHNPSFLSYTGATEGSSSAPATLSAHLVNEVKALEHRKVHFAVGAESCEAETNSSGDASCSVTIKDAPGNYTVTATFAGDAAYLKSEASAPFTVNAAPTVTTRKPTAGPVGGGTTVTITGTNLTGATAVKFGSVNAASFKVNSSTSITAVSPAEAAGTVDITVTTPGGTSATSTADRFKFLPTVTGVSPNTGSKVGGTSVTITGTGFALGKTATTVKFGTAKGTSVNCSSTTQCTAVSPAHAVGTVDVRVTVNKATSAKATADRFTYS